MLRNLATKISMDFVMIFCVEAGSVGVASWRFVGVVGYFVFYELGACMV